MSTCVLYLSFNCICLLLFKFLFIYRTIFSKCVFLFYSFVLFLLSYMFRLVVLFLFINYFQYICFDCFKRSKRNRSLTFDVSRSSISSPMPKLNKKSTMQNPNANVEPTIRDLSGQVPILITGRLFYSQIHPLIRSKQTIWLEAQFKKV